MGNLNWGIMATGRIARAFAVGLGKSQTGVLTAVGSRNIESSTAFCQEFGGEPLGSYEALAAHPEVEAIYVATPHHTHEVDTILCARHGKHILCEKPFTLNLPSTERALAVVKETGVFFAEAFMYRFAPQTKAVLQKIREGVIGEVHHVRAEFSYASSRTTQNFRFERELGGGGLMDVGVYCVSMSRAIFQAEPIRCEYAIEPTERGYDAVGTGLMAFEGGKTASFSTGVHLQMKNSVIVYGDEGWLEIMEPWFANGRVLVCKNGEQEWLGPWPYDDLYACEIEGVAASIDKGEAPEITIADTLGQARAIDMLKASAGMKF